MVSHTHITCLAALFATAGCTTMEAQIKSSGAMGKTDADYATVSYQLVQMDQQAGKLAATKARDPRVQSVAANLMAQATAFAPGVQSALNAQGIKPPSGLPQDQVAQITTLQGLSGAAFDKQYVADELAMHKRAVSVLQQEAANTKDGALSVQVQSELPAVQDNLNTLQVLADEYGGKRSS